MTPFPYHFRIFWRDELSRLKGEVEKLTDEVSAAYQRGVGDAAGIRDEDNATLRAQNERLREAVNVAIRQLGDGNRVLATATLCAALTGTTHKDTSND